jgi:hypothetical protein
MTKTLLIYDRPVSLNRERHRHLHIDPNVQSMAFAKNSNSFLLAATELADAAMHYPTVFVGQPDGPFTLAVLVGLHDQQNLFIGDDGRWAAGAYVPAFVRRYPFVLAQADDDSDADLSVCVDEAHTGFSGWAGQAPAPGAVPLFSADGSNSPMLVGAVTFLEQFNAQMKRTREFAALLADFGLLQKRVIEIKRGKDVQALDGLYVVSEERIAELKANQIKRLVEKQFMGWIYAHLLSLRHVQVLADKQPEPALG